MNNPAPNNPRRAAAMILLASALFAATTILAKFLGTTQNPLHPLQVSAGRFFFAFITIATFAAITRPKITAPNLPLHFGRSLLGWIGVSLMFAAVARIPLPDATAISFLNPVFAMLFAIVILKEVIGKWRWLAAAIALIGAIILLRPSANSMQPAAFLALGAACVMGLEVILIKFLSGREKPVQILLINNTIGAALACTAAYFVWQTPTSTQWLGLVAIGVVMLCGQALFIQAMRSAEASYVAPFSYATLVFATLYDFWVFGAKPDAISILGAATILSGAALLAWREARLPAKP
ncbi:DMT family transporter [Amylibacter sp.]|nr:DMT family transporter [Amylibacter sp.]MDB9857044.1 DMT family transporter [Amylibacter sp.]